MEFTADTKIKTRILGVSTQKYRFDFLFGTVLGQLIIGHSSNLKCDLPSENQPSSHLVVFREIPI